jgi:hypothetical protein
MGNKQHNQEPRHEPRTHEGQRLGGNNQGGKAPEHVDALDQGGDGGQVRRAQRHRDSRGKFAPRTH